MPTYTDQYIIASQGMALMKVPFDATPSSPGVPIYMKAFMTATGLDIDCLKGKVRAYFYQWFG